MRVIYAQGTRVRTRATVYAGLQKQQRVNLTKLPAGTPGMVKSQGYDEGAIYCWVRLTLGERVYWAKLSPMVIERVEDAGA